MGRHARRVRQGNILIDMGIDEMSQLKVINTEEEYETELTRLGALMDENPAPGSEDSEYINVLAVLIENYENQHFYIEPPDPVDAIKFRMDQMGLSNKDMIPYLGSKARVSEVLNRKRPLNLTMMRSLRDGLGISADTLLRESSVQSLDETTGWEGFPIKEMHRRNYFFNYSDPMEVKENEEQAVWGFLRSVNEPNLRAALLRTSAKSHERSARLMDHRSLLAWSTRVFQKVESNLLVTEFVSGCITDGFVKDLLELSQYESGPKLAVEYLARFGIYLIIERHFSKTYLDGAAFMSDGGNPVIGLTLRYDRIDNFWFVLMHELGHIALHLDNGEKDKLFFDDLEARPDSDDLENEADTFAREHLIPTGVWNESKVKDSKDAKSAIQLARELKIHPAIVVGRLQNEEKNYRLLSKSIGRGQGEVRGLFEEFD